jgi:hypothetical protein
LNCGGLGVQKSNGIYIYQRNLFFQYIHLYLGGKCGICGDAYAGPRYHEIGGKYATNIVVRHYLSGALIDVKILVKLKMKDVLKVFFLYLIVIS